MLQSANITSQRQTSSNLDLGSCQSLVDHHRGTTVWAGPRRSREGSFTEAWGRAGRRNHLSASAHRVNIAINRPRGRLAPGRARLRPPLYDEFAANDIDPCHYRSRHQRNGSLLCSFRELASVQSFPESRSMSCAASDLREERVKPEMHLSSIRRTASINPISQPTQPHKVVTPRREKTAA